MDKNTQTLTDERGAIYGHPLDDFARIAKMKAPLQECTDLEVRHALEMILVKISRLIETPDHKDSIADIQGYAHCITKIHEERAKRKTDSLHLQQTFHELAMPKS